MSSIYFYYYLWIALTIFFFLGSIRLFTYNKEEGTKPFGVILVILGIITSISIINSPSLSSRLNNFKSYTSITSDELKSIRIINSKSNKSLEFLSSKEIEKVLAYLHQASPLYFPYDLGKMKNEFKIVLETNKGKTIIIRAKTYEYNTLIDLTNGPNEVMIGRFVNRSPSFF